MVNSLRGVMWLVVLGLFSGGGRAWAQPSTTASEVACPKTVRVSARLESPMDGWDERVRFEVNQLDNASVYERPPSELVRLVPDEEEERGPLSVSLWRLTPSKHGYWLECSYRGTDVAIFRKIDDRFTVCELVVDTRRMLSGKPQMVGAGCKVEKDNKGSKLDPVPGASPNAPAKAKGPPSKATRPKGPDREKFNEVQ